MRVRTVMTAALPLSALVALGACRGGGEQMQAGQWEMTTSVVDVSMPGAPADKIEEAKSKRDTRTTCLSEEEARDPVRMMMQNSQNSACAPRDMKMEGGRITGTLNCQQGPVQMTGEIEGEYSADTIDMQIETQMQAPQGPGRMEMTMRVEGRRAGECTGSEAKS